MNRVAKGIALVAAASLLAACSSSGGSSGGNSSGTSSSTSSGSSVSTSSSSSSGSSSASGGGDTSKVHAGLTIGVMTTVSGAEVTARWASTAVSGLKQIGIKTVQGNGNGQPATQNQVLASFISQKVAGILISAPLYTDPIAQELRAAKSAGIPVFAFGGSRIDDPNHLLTGDYAVSPTELGKTLATYLVKKYPSGTKWVYIDLPAIAAAHQPIVAGTPVLNAAGWKLAGHQDLDASDFFPKTGPAAVSLLQATPDAKVLFSCCDYLPGVTVPALARAGYPKVVTAAEFDDLTSLALIRAHKPVVVVAANTDIGPAVAVDQLLKVLSGGTADQNADAGLYHYKVIDSTNLPPAGQYAYPPQTTLAPYVKKWLSEYPKLKG